MWHYTFYIIFFWQSLYQKNKKSLNTTVINLWTVNVYDWILTFFIILS